MQTDSGADNGPDLTSSKADSHPNPTAAGRPLLAALALGALGVVYGDIGTSPLYALRSCFAGHSAVPATHDNVLGLLSLIFWSLILIVSVKYLAFVMRADNRGEGGILALLALAFPERDKASPARASPGCSRRWAFLARRCFMATG